jgi:hypothetical protein
MATYSRQLLSGSTNGRNIPVAAIATPGTLLHTAVAGTASFDELYLWAANVTGSAATLTIEFGGVTDPGDHLVKAYSIPANSAPIPICTGRFPAPPAPSTSVVLSTGSRDAARPA